MNSAMIGWEAVSSAELELFSPGPNTNAYQLRYTPSFRTTIRPPTTELVLGAADIKDLKDRMDRLGSARQQARGPALPGVPRPNMAQDAKTIGEMLFALVIPSDVQADLRTENLFLEIGADEGLLEYPWELLHDGDDFLAAKHYVGRYVNVVRGSSVLAQQRNASWKDDDVLRVLLISVPHPQLRIGEPPYEGLPGAESETKAILDLLLPLGPAVQVTLLKGANATASEVFAAIRDTRFHIVHFNGHAFFSDKAYQSSLVLWDKNMSVTTLRAFFAKNPPVLFVMNACETAASAASGKEWSNSYEIFGLARAFLETGAYLLGTRWRVDDAAALEFARTLYCKMLEGKPLGMAIRDARVACRGDKANDDLSWASYLFYGDPRIYFRKVITAPANPQP